MAGNLTEYGAGLVAASRAGTYWIGLGTGQSSTTLTGEPSGGSYARVSVTLTASGRLLTNGSAVTFSATTISFAGLTHAGLFDASSGGNCIWVGPLDTALTLHTEGVTIAAGDIDIAIETAT